jgi:hypothetical protein
MCAPGGTDDKPRSDPPRLIPCRLCATPIPGGARLCPVCGSYQNWLGSLNRSGLVLSLLVALVSVLSVAIPAFQTALRPARSELRVLRYYFTETGVSLVLTNKGAMPGFVSSCKMDVLSGNKWIWTFNFNLDQRSETRVVKGDSVAELFFKTDHVWMNTLLSEKIGPQWQEQVSDLTQKLDFQVTQFDGSSEHVPGIVSPLKDFYYKY